MIDPDPLEERPVPDVCRFAPKEHFQPILDENWRIDDRLEKKPLEVPDACDDLIAPPLQRKFRFPVKYMGLAMAGDEETSQEELFVPTDPRLIAVNRPSDPEFGTLVVDTNENFEIDTSRCVPLQSLVRVIKDPEGCIRFGERQSNALAIQLDESECRDVAGGMVFGLERPIEPGVEVRSAIAMMSQRASGPFEIGRADGEDKHTIGRDKDDHAINALHLSTEAYYYRDTLFDGPLTFENLWQGCAEGPDSTCVHLEFDPRPVHSFVCGPRQGRWRWRATTFDCVIPPVDFPGPSEPPVFAAIRRNGTGGGAGEEDPRPFLPTVKDGDYRRREILSTAIERSFPAILARPQFVADDKPDLRNISNPNAFRSKTSRDKPFTEPGGNGKNGNGFGGKPPPGQDGPGRGNPPPSEPPPGLGTDIPFPGKNPVFVQALMRTPIVARLEGFGEQGADDWTFTKGPDGDDKAGKRRYRVPSANGGFVLTPPELGLEDVDRAAYETGDAALSRAWFVFPPFTRLAFGLPDLATGTVKDDSYWLQYQDDADLSTVALHLRRMLSGSAQDVLRISGDAAGSVRTLYCVGSKSTESTRTSWGTPDIVGGTLAEGYHLAFDGPAAQLKLKSEDKSGTATALIFDLDENMQFGTFPSFGKGKRVIGIENAATVPTAKPRNGGILYAEDGCLKWKGSRGTVTTLATA